MAAKAREGIDRGQEKRYWRHKKYGAIGLPYKSQLFGNTLDALEFNDFPPEIRVW